MSAPDRLTLTRVELIRTQALVDGQWTNDPSGRTFDIFDPASGEQVARVADGDAALATRATDAATNAFPAWRATSPRARARLLRAWFDLVVANGEDLARLISWEMGKPLAEARGEVAYGAAYLEWFAEEARRIDGEVLASPVAGREMLVRREPVGVAALITPWNFPAAMIARKLAPALAAGCTVVAKPAEDTPLSALALAFLGEEAGFPTGVINMVPASRQQTPEIVQAWIDDARVRKLSFTGSTTVGKLLARGAADTLKRMSLELGGDAPFIVFEDADLDVAVAALMRAKFRNAGQACVAANRIFVQEAIHDAFAERLSQAVAGLTVGPAADGDFDIGPLINQRALEKVERLVEQAVTDGARVLIGGGRHARGGLFYSPTVLAGVAADAALSCEEIFGPVAPLLSFATEEEVVRRANATPYGLAGYVCTRDLGRAMRVADALEVGMVGVNEGVISSEQAPFGGVKQSGYGREGSRHGISEYQSLKYLCLNGLS